jgi:hypothetical protein
MIMSLQIEIESEKIEGAKQARILLWPIRSASVSIYEADGSETTWGLDSGTFWIFLHDLDIYHDFINFF